MGDSETSDFCAGSTSHQQRVFNYGLSTFFSLGLLSMMPGIYRFISAYMRKDLQSPRRLFLLSITYYIILMLYISSVIIYIAATCQDAYAQMYSVAALLASFLYSSQFLLFLAILFYKLVSIFKETVFALSTRLIAVFTALICVSFVMGSAGFTVAYLSSSKQWISIGLVAMSMTSGLAILLLILLNVLFIGKLINASKSSRAAGKFTTDDISISLITKTSVLCFVGTWMTMLCITLFISWVSVPRLNVHSYLASVAILCDVYTNYLSVLLSFSYFNEWYFRLCGCCDRCLRARCISNEQQLSAENRKENDSTQDTQDMNVNEETQRTPDDAGNEAEIV